MQIDSSMIDDKGFLVTKHLGDLSKLDGVGIEITIQHPDTHEIITIENNAKVPKPADFLISLEKELIGKTISELETMNLLLTTDSAIKKKLADIISFDTGNLITISTMAVNTVRIESGSMLFRIRKIWDSDIERIERVTDVSYVPDDKVEKIRFGRVNDKREQVMYLADTLHTAIKESRLNKGDIFYLSIFINREQLDLLCIGGVAAEDDAYKEVHNLVSNFLLKQFTKTVAYDKEYEYRLSNIIAKEFYNYKEQNLDGWLYPSIALNGATNVALNKNVTDKKIEFLVCFKGEMISETAFTLEKPMIEDIMDDKLIYLADIVNTKEMMNFNKEDILRIEDFWLSFSQKS